MQVEVWQLPLPLRTAAYCRGEVMPPLAACQRVWRGEFPAATALDVIYDAFQRGADSLLDRLDAGALQLGLAGGYPMRQLAPGDVVGVRHAPGDPMLYVLCTEGGWIPGAFLAA